MVNLLRRALHRLPRPLKRFLRNVPGVGWVRQAAAGRPRGPRPSKGTPRPVVYLPTWLQWDVMRQRPQYLLAALSRAGHPVFFVDPRVVSSRQEGGVTLAPSLTAVPPRDVILYVHFAPIRDLFDRFENAAVVYDLLDDLSIYDADEVGMPERRRVRAHHHELVAAADVVTASSPVLVDRHRHERSDIVLVENGVEPERFGGIHPRPAEIPAGAPVIGYHGAVARWFDFELFGTVARANPRWRFVLVGPVAPEVRGRLDELSQVSNVIVVGEQPIDRVPAYVGSFDVGAIWFRVDGLTEAVNPLKMFEYLAAGVPVVSTAIPAAEASTEVHVAESPTQMTAAIEAALAEPSTRMAARQAAANAASWDVRIRTLLRRLEELGQRSVP